MVKSRFPAGTPARNLSRRAIALPLCLLSCLLLSTCEFLTSDIFPSWLSYTDAVLDLDELLYEESGHFITKPNVDDPNTVLVEYLRSSGGDYVCIYFTYTNNPPQVHKLLILDGNDMSLLSSIDNFLFYNMLSVDVNGDIICGSASVDPDTFTPTTEGITSPGGRQWLVPDPTLYSEYNFIAFCNDGMNIVNDQYSSAWAYSGGGYTFPVGGGPSESDYYPSGGWTLRDAEGVSTGYGYWLFTNNSGPAAGGYLACCYPSDMETCQNDGDSFLFFSNANSPLTQATGPFPVDEDGWAWITAGGPVAFRRGDKGPDRLVRYKPGTGSVDITSYTYSTELDSIPFDSDDKRVLSFDPEGRYWFFYDRKSGLLYKMRTWWK